MTTKKFDIDITQNGLLNGLTNKSKAKLYYSNNNLEIELLENNFNEFEDTKSRFEIHLEIDDESGYDFFDLSLTANRNLDTFEIIKDAESLRLKAFLLDKELKFSGQKKPKKNKI